MEAVTNFIQSPSFTTKVERSVSTFANKVSAYTNDDSRRSHAASFLTSGIIKVVNFAVSFIFFLGEATVRGAAALITSPLALNARTKKLPVFLMNSAMTNANLAFGRTPNTTAIRTPDAPEAPVTETTTATRTREASPEAPVATGIENATDFRSGPVSPLITLFGCSLDDASDGTT